MSIERAIQVKGPAKRVSAALSKLVAQHPFIANIALSLHIHMGGSEKGIPTAGTDGKSIWFNDDFVESLNDQELLFLVAHECMHPALMHIFRRKGRDMGRWNRAADYVVNQYLVDDSVGIMPKEGLYDKNLYEEGNGFAERIYDLLKEKDKGKGDKPGKGKGEGGALDVCIDAEPDVGGGETKSSMENEWKIRVVQAAKAAKMAGKCSANLERFVGGLVKSVVDWRDVLSDFLVKARNDERSWARPARRFASMGRYYPSISGEVMGEVVFAVDCSGSVSNEELTQYASEVVSVWNDMRPIKTHIIYFDHSVCHIDTFDVDTEPTISARGGGGTAFSPVFKAIEQNDFDPVACVFLTDLCCSDFGPTPEYPVLWVSTLHNKDVPFGSVIPMNLR